MEKHYENLNRKLDKLNNSHQQRTRRAAQGHQQEFYPCNVNLTDIKFTKEELELMDMGLQYNIQQASKTNWTNLVIETEQAIRLMEARNQDAYRILAAKKLKQLQHNLNNSSTKHKRQIHLRTSNTRSKKTMPSSQRQAKAKPWLLYTLRTITTS